MLTTLYRRLSSPSRSASAVVLAAIVALGVGCGGDSTRVTVAAAVEAGISGASFQGTVGSALTVSPTFIVKDASGAALAGKSVTVAVTAGGGTISGAPTVSAAGATSVGVWKLGNTAGTNAITVSVSGVPSLTLNATGVPDAPASVAIIGGDVQSAPAGTVLTQPISAKVSDKFGNGVPGQSVSFAVAAGGGTLAAAAPVVTGANGIALAPSWTLGKSNVAQQLTATAGSLATLVSATVATSFSIDLRQYGPAVSSSSLDAAVQAAFVSAKSRLSAEITGGVAPQLLANLSAAALSSCNVGGQSSSSITIAGVLIFYAVDSIDGVGRILGSAGPCTTRDNHGLTVLGRMLFDSADVRTLVTNGIFNDVILHEMHHVLGFGTLWDWVLPTLRVRTGTPLTGYIGRAAIAACTAMGGGTGVCLDSIPLEHNIGPGSDYSHWSEAFFKSELMTPRVAGAAKLPLSPMTIASMQDLGYTVNLAAADAIVLSGLLRSVSDPFGLQDDGNSRPISERVLLPRFVVNSAGQLSRMPGRQ